VGAPSKEARPPLVAGETQHRIDARPSGHGPPHGRGALLCFGGRRFATIGVLTKDQWKLEIDLYPEPCRNYNGRREPNHSNERSVDLV
jgi:hypothetical protein